MQEDSSAFETSIDSGICEDTTSPTPDDKMASKIKTYQQILVVLERDKLLRAEQRKRLSQLAEKRQRKKRIEESCNVCCSELNADELKSCVKCINCQKNACRGPSCTVWIPSRSGWECQLCNESQESISKSNEWLHQQITGRYLSPFSARSEPSLLRNHLSSTPELDRRSEAASSFYGDQRERVREVIEETLAEMLGGSLDNISVNQLYKSREYLELFCKYHSPLSHKLHGLERSMLLSQSVKDLPTWENGEAPGLSHVKLKRFIEKVVNDAIRLPSFTNEPITPGPINDQSLPFFDPKKYQELLATAVLNKIVDSYNYEQKFDSNRDAATDCSDLDNNHNALVGRKVQSGSISSSSIEPESDCSITDPPSNISRLDDFSRRDSGSNPLADVMSQCDQNNSSRLNDYLTRHNVPFPDFSIESDSSNEDNMSAAKNIGSSWEGNWLFKKKRPGHESPAPVGMLVPCPKEDIKTQIGDKTADELSDLSEAGSECGDNHIEEIEDSSQNALIQNKNIIGGKSPIGIFDELFEQTSLISSSSLPEGDSVYTETKNDFVLGDDLRHDLVQAETSFRAEEAINSLVDTQTLRNNLSNSKEHEKRPPTKASLEEIPKPKPRMAQKAPVYANTQEIAEVELTCSSAASSAIASEGACNIATDDCLTHPTNNTNTLAADDIDSECKVTESMLKKIQCTKASAIQFLVVVSMAPSLAVPAVDAEAINNLAQIQNNGNTGEDNSVSADEVNGNTDEISENLKPSDENLDLRPDIRCIPLPECVDTENYAEESDLDMFIPPPVEFSSDILEGTTLLDEPTEEVEKRLTFVETLMVEPDSEKPTPNLEPESEQTIEVVGKASETLVDITLKVKHESKEKEESSYTLITQEELTPEFIQCENIIESTNSKITEENVVEISTGIPQAIEQDVHEKNPLEDTCGTPFKTFKFENPAEPIQNESAQKFEESICETVNIMCDSDETINTENLTQCTVEEKLKTVEFSPEKIQSTDDQSLDGIAQETISIEHLSNQIAADAATSCKMNPADIVMEADIILETTSTASLEVTSSVNETAGGEIIEKSEEECGLPLATTAGHNNSELANIIDKATPKESTIGLIESSNGSTTVPLSEVIVEATSCHPSEVISQECEISREEISINIEKVEDEIMIPPVVDEYAKENKKNSVHQEDSLLSEETLKLSSVGNLESPSSSFVEDFTGIDSYKEIKFDADSSTSLTSEINADDKADPVPESLENVSISSIQLPVISEQVDTVQNNLQPIKIKEIKKEVTIEQPLMTTGIEIGETDIISIDSIHELTERMVDNETNKDSFFSQKLENQTLHLEPVEEQTTVKVTEAEKSHSKGEQCVDSTEQPYLKKETEIETCALRSDLSMENRTNDLKNEMQADAQPKEVVPKEMTTDTHEDNSTNSVALFESLLLDTKDCCAAIFVDTLDVNPNLIVNDSCKEANVDLIFVKSNELKEGEHLIDAIKEPIVDSSDASQTLAENIEVESNQKIVTNEKDAESPSDSIGSEKEKNVDTLELHPQMEFKNEISFAGIQPENTVIEVKCLPDEAHIPTNAGIEIHESPNSTKNNNIIDRSIHQQDAPTLDEELPPECMDSNGNDFNEAILCEAPLPNACLCTEAEDIKLSDTIQKSWLALLDNENSSMDIDQMEADSVDVDFLESSEIVPQFDSEEGLLPAIDEETNNQEMCAGEKSILPSDLIEDAKVDTLSITDAKKSLEIVSGDNSKEFPVKDQEGITNEELESLSMISTISETENTSPLPKSLESTLKESHENHPSKEVFQEFNLNSAEKERTIAASEELNESTNLFSVNSEKMKEDLLEIKDSGSDSKTDLVAAIIEPNEIESLETETQGSAEMLSGKIDDSTPAKCFESQSHSNDATVELENVLSANANLVKHTLIEKDGINPEADVIIDSVAESVPTTDSSTHQHEDTFLKPTTKHSSEPSKNIKNASPETSGIVAVVAGSISESTISMGLEEPLPEQLTTQVALKTLKDSKQPNMDLESSTKALLDEYRQVNDADALEIEILDIERTGQLENSLSGVHPNALSSTAADNTFPENLNNTEVNSEPTTDVTNLQTTHSKINEIKVMAESEIQNFDLGNKEQPEPMRASEQAIIEREKTDPALETSSLPTGVTGQRSCQENDGENKSPIENEVMTTTNPGAKTPAKTIEDAESKISVSLVDSVRPSFQETNVRQSSNEASLEESNEPDLDAKNKSVECIREIIQEESMTDVVSIGANRTEDDLKIQSGAAISESGSISDNEVPNFSEDNTSKIMESTSEILLPESAIADIQETEAVIRTPSITESCSDNFPSGKDIKTEPAPSTEELQNLISDNNEIEQVVTLLPNNSEDFNIISAENVHEGTIKPLQDNIFKGPSDSVSSTGNTNFPDKRDQNAKLTSKLEEPVNSGADKITATDKVAKAEDIFEISTATNERVNSEPLAESNDLLDRFTDDASTNLAFHLVENDPDRTISFAESTNISSDGKPGDDVTCSDIALNLRAKPSNGTLGEPTTILETVAPIIKSLQGCQEISENTVVLSELCIAADKLSVDTTTDPEIETFTIDEVGNADDGQPVDNVYSEMLSDQTTSLADKQDSEVSKDAAQDHIIISSPLEAIIDENQGYIDTKTSLKINLEEVSDALEQALSSEVNSGGSTSNLKNDTPALTPHNSVEDLIADTLEEMLEPCSQLLADTQNMKMGEIGIKTISDAETPVILDPVQSPLSKENDSKSSETKEYLLQLESPLRESSTQEGAEPAIDDSQSNDGSVPISETLICFPDTCGDEKLDPAEVETFLASIVDDAETTLLAKADTVPKSMDTTGTAATQLDVSLEMIIASAEEESSESDFNKLAPQTVVGTIDRLQNSKEFEVVADIEESRQECKKVPTTMDSESSDVTMDYVFELVSQDSCSSGSSFADSLEMCTETSSPDEATTEDDNEFTPKVNDEVEQSTVEVEYNIGSTEVDSNSPSANSPCLLKPIGDIYDPALEEMKATVNPNEPSTESTYSSCIIEPVVQSVNAEVIHTKELNSNSTDETLSSDTTIESERITPKTNTFLVTELTGDPVKPSSDYALDPVDQNIEPEPVGDTLACDVLIVESDTISVSTEEFLVKQIALESTGALQNTCSMTAENQEPSKYVIAEQYSGLGNAAENLQNEIKENTFTPAGAFPTFQVPSDEIDVNERNVNESPALHIQMEEIIFDIGESKEDPPFVMNNIKGSDLADVTEKVNLVSIDKTVTPDKIEDTQQQSSRINDTNSQIDKIVANLIEETNTNDEIHESISKDEVNPEEQLPIKTNENDILTIFSLDIQSVENNLDINADNPKAEIISVDSEIETHQVATDEEQIPTILVTASSLEYVETCRSEQILERTPEVSSENAEKSASDPEKTESLEDVLLSDSQQSVISNKIEANISKSQASGINETELKTTVDKNSDNEPNEEHLEFCETPENAIVEENLEDKCSELKLDSKQPVRNEMLNGPPESHQAIVSKVVESISENQISSEEYDIASKPKSLCTTSSVVDEDFIHQQPPLFIESLAARNDSVIISIETNDVEMKFPDPCEQDSLKSNKANREPEHENEPTSVTKSIHTVSGNDQKQFEIPPKEIGFPDALEIKGSYLKVISSSEEDISTYDTPPSSFSELSNQTPPSSLTMTETVQDDSNLDGNIASPICKWSVNQTTAENYEISSLTESYEKYLVDLETTNYEPTIEQLSDPSKNASDRLSTSEATLAGIEKQNQNQECLVTCTKNERGSVEYFITGTSPLHKPLPREKLGVTEEIQIYQGRCKQTELLSPDVVEASLSPRIEVGEEAIVALEACASEDDPGYDYIVSNENNYDSMQVLETMTAGIDGIQIVEMEDTTFTLTDSIPWHSQKDDCEEAESEHSDSLESEPELSITPPEIALCYMTPHILDSIPEDLEMAESPPDVPTKLVSDVTSSISENDSLHVKFEESILTEPIVVEKQESEILGTDSDSQVSLTVEVDSLSSGDCSANTTQQAETHSLHSFDIADACPKLSTITNTDLHEKDVELSTLPTDKLTCIESSSTITTTPDDTVCTAIESPSRKVTVETTNDDVVDAHKRSETTPSTSPTKKSYSVSMSLQLTCEPTNNASLQQATQTHCATDFNEHSQKAPPSASPLHASAAPAGNAEAPHTQQQQIKFDILKHAAFSQPLLEEEDAVYTGHPSHFLPGSIAEREHRKWYNAVEMPNNPYSREALKRRLSTSSDKPIDIPNINSPLDKVASEDKLSRGGSEDEDVTAAIIVDYKRYGRDYYINHAKHASGSSKQKLTASTSLHGLNTGDDQTCDTEATTLQKALSSSSLHRSHSWGDKRSSSVAGGGSTCDIFTARPVRVEESDPILTRATKLEYLSTPDRDFYLLPSEEISSLRSISASEHSLSQAGDSLTPSEDSDTIRVYDLKKQETRLIRDDDDDSVSSVAAAVKGLSNPSSTSTQSPTHARPQLVSQRSFRTTIIQRGSTPTAFKFLQPKRRLYDTRRVMSEDTSPAVREEILRTNGSIEKSVIEEDVIPALPSVKALAKVFQATSPDANVVQTNRPKSFSWKSVDVKMKEEFTPSPPVTPIESTQLATNGDEQSATEPAKDSYSPTYDKNYIPAETPVSLPIPSAVNGACAAIETQEKTLEPERSVTSETCEPLNEATPITNTSEAEATQPSVLEESAQKVMEVSFSPTVLETVEALVPMSEKAEEEVKEAVQTAKEPSRDSYSPPYDQKYNPVEFPSEQPAVDDSIDKSAEQKVDQSNSLEWKEDNVEIISTPKDDHVSTPPSTPVLDEQKSTEEETAKPIFAPTLLLVDINEAPKTEVQMQLHEPTAVEQFLYSEKNAAMLPVTSSTEPETASESQEEKLAPASESTSAPLVDVDLHQAVEVASTTEVKTEVESKSEEVVRVEKTTIEQHTQVLEQTSTERTETTSESAPILAEELTSTVESPASLDSGLPAEPVCMNTEPTSTTEMVSEAKETHDESAAATEPANSLIEEQISTTASMSDQSLSPKLSEEAATPIPPADDVQQAANAVNGPGEPTPTSPTQKNYSEQTKQNGTDPKRSEIRFTQEMPPIDRPISPVLVPGKLKSSIAFFENLKNKK